MFKLFLLSLLFASAIAWGYRSVNHTSTLISAHEVSMSSNHSVIKSIRLIAREQRRPPLGELPKADRDIGFATVFLTIENAQQEPANLVIERIQIEDANNSHVQLEHQGQQKIRLKPLENSVNDFHLTNKVGYTTQNRVKAVVTYQIDNQSHVIASDPVAVERD
jgi:hypothetical protein